MCRLPNVDGIDKTIPGKILTGEKITNVMQGVLVLMKHRIENITTTGMRAGIEITNPMEKGFTVIVTSIAGFTTRSIALLTRIEIQYMRGRKRGTAASEMDQALCLLKF